MGMSGVTAFDCRSVQPFADLGFGGDVGVGTT
jgi:hypothetical protein